MRPCSRVSAITKFCLSLCTLQSPPPVHAARGRTPSSHQSRADGSAGWAVHAGGPRGMQTADGVGGGRGASRTLTWALGAGGPASWVRSGGRAIRPNHPDGPWQVEPRISPVHFCGFKAVEPESRRHWSLIRTQAETHRDPTTCPDLTPVRRGGGHLCLRSTHP